MERDLPDQKTAESAQGDRLHLYQRHSEYERRVLAPAEQDLLRLTDALKRETFDTIGLHSAYKEQKETHLENDVISGHPDLLRFYESGPGVILEYKFGWSQVEPADLNLQTRVYAVLSPTEDTYVAIIQPRPATTTAICLPNTRANATT